MRGFYPFLSAFLGLLLVSSAHASKKEFTPDVTDTDVSDEPPPPPRRDPPPPPRRIVKDDKDKKDLPPAIEDEDVAEEPPPPPQHYVDPEPMPPARQSHGHFSLNMGFSFGQRPSCMIPNCGSFMRVMPQQPQQVIYQDVYMNEAPSYPQYQGNPCGCGQMGCGCGGGGGQNVLFVNQAQQPIWATNNFIPRWQPLNVRMQPVWPVQQPAVFTVPQPMQQHLNGRDGGFIPRSGYGTGSGIM